ncbi:MAG: MFS transporter [Candidatus Bathyarchaeota archaeon]|nr:MAG: MFS transporter [Candidatus Bathyarchaeota archaeon]
MKRETGVLLLLGAAHSLNHSLFLVLPPLLEDISRDLGASFQTLGLVTTVAFLLYGLGALVGGPLSDRMGHVRIARVSIGLAGVSTLVFLLPSSLVVFGAGLWAIASWASFYHPTANTLIAKLYTEYTARSMGIHGASASVGQMLTPTVAYLIGTAFHWRYAFVFFGAASMATSLLMRRIPPVQDPARAERTPLLEILRVPGLWVLIFYNVVIGLFQRGVELFFPTFLTVERGFPGRLAALFNSLLLLIGVAGQLMGGWASDRYSSKRFLVVASLGMVVSMLFLLLLPFRSAGVVAFVVLYGLFFFGHQPTMTSLLGSVSPMDLMGMAYGVMFFFAFGLGSVSTTISGYLADNFSLEAVFWIMALFSFMTLVISLVIPRVVKDRASGNKQ